MTAPETRYARSADVNIAYQVVGEGPFDLVHVPGGSRTSTSCGTSVHTGEVELSDDDVLGIAGGEHGLEGVPGAWRVFAASAGASIGRATRSGRLSEAPAGGSHWS